MIKGSRSRAVFIVFNYIFLTFIMFLCIVPLVHMLAVSLSDNRYAVAGMVTLWPKGFTTSAYSFLYDNPAYLRSLLITLERVGLGIVVNMSLCIITAFALAQDNAHFHGRTVYAWFFAITMFVHGGTIPTYFVVSKLRLVNTIWALILPGALSVWNCVMMMNFFRRLPTALSEAAFIDGANYFQVLLRIYLPISLPSLATILLFTMVGHWNSWFDGYIYMNYPESYPLQTYLMTVVTSAMQTTKEFMTPEQLEALAKVNEKTLRMAQVFLGALPIMCVYPFLQRYFIKGMVLGAVKE